jgi:hypothetical protein
MKFCSARFGFAKSLVALSVSFAVVVSTQSFAFASLTGTSSTSSQKQTESPGELRLIEATANASATAGGVLIQWRTNYAADNLGFNVYRLQAGQRVRINKAIIPGGVFAPAAPALLHSGYSYSWFDRGGTSNSTYFIESVSLQGTAKLHEAIRPLVSKTIPGFGQETRSGDNPSATASAYAVEKYYPAAETGLNSPKGTIQDQWAIAAQTALKIAVKKDGWYRVTQPQMVAAGFNPTVDIRNLRLFVEANEVAISTSQLTGPFGSGDYIEFYGRGLDTVTTDSRTYYLVAGTTPGKRVRGELQLDSPADPTPTPTPAPTALPSPISSPASSPSISPATPTSQGPVLRDPIFYGWAQNDVSALMDLGSPNTSINRDKREQGSRAGNTQADSAPYDYSQAFNSPAETVPAEPRSGNEQTAAADRHKQGQEALSTVGRNDSNNSARSLRLPVPTRRARSLRRSVLTRNSRLRSRAIRKRAGKVPKRGLSKKRKVNTLARKSNQERNHANLIQGFTPANFDNIAERKDRTVYFVALLNGDKDNYFGTVLDFQTISSPNRDLAAAQPSRLEIGLQGANLIFHQVSVEFNGVVVGSFSFFGRDPNSGGHPVQVFNIPVTQLQNGANTVRFILPNGDSTLIDYVKLSYPHTFSADANSLRFDLRGTQSVKVDGFTTPSVRLIDYTDPLNVSITKPPSESSGSGFAITVPASDPPSKASRLLYAIPQGQFDQPASITLSQPSSLNLNTNAADFLIISHKDFVQSVEPLRIARGNQGLVAKVVDVEDVYDEFSYGLHGPQAVRDFLLRASTEWATKPRYIVFAGDASLDPRNYEGVGNFDMVPTKLVDASYNETASDDWLADFDDDGIADIPVGRLPVRTVVDANLIISKILNFTPVTPQSAMLVADDPTGYYFNFEQANDQVQALLPAAMTVQRVNVRVDGPGISKTNVINGFNQGRALVNYTGHGNVDVWSGASIFKTADAFALTNGSSLSFVVVMDCLNGYFQDPRLLSLSEALLEAPQGGAVAAFASSGLTLPDGQHEMSQQLYSLIYGAQPIALGDAIKNAKNATNDIDVRRTWIFFGDPSMKIR